jgi:hypothetical protein
VTLDDLLRENRMIEWLQIGLCAGIALVAAPALRKGGSVLHRALFFFVLAAMFRELDSFLEEHAMDGTDIVGIWVSLAAGLAVIWRGRTEIGREFTDFLFRPGFLIMGLGFLLVTVYAQFFGLRDIWEIFSRGPAVRGAKRFVEEGLEIMGYFWIGCGMIEDVIFARREASLKK